MKAALLDDNDVFLGIVEVDVPGARHLPQINECDLPPGKYRWIADPANAAGGAFWPIAFLERREQDARDVQAARGAAARLAQRRAQRKQERGE
jgi:hypothetical protein